MKKLLALLLAAVMCLSLAACGGGEETPQANDNNSTEQGEQSGGEMQNDDNASTNEMLVVSGTDGTPALNGNMVGNYIECVELTVDNWREYLKVYTYDVEVVEKDAFGEITNTEVVEVFCLGYGNNRYHSFEAIIELQHKETGETLFANMELGYVFLLASDGNLDEYECTRIQGNIYFFNFPEEVLEEVISLHDREEARYPNAKIEIADGGMVYSWSVDTDAKVITNPSGSSWGDYN